MPGALDREGLYRQAISVHQRGALESARLLYEQILALDPLDFDSRHMLGVVHLQSGEPARAAEFISAALNINPASADAHCNLGQALRAMCRYQDALASYGEAIALSPAGVIARIGKANVFLKLDRLEEALAICDEALALDPSNGQARRMRETIRRQLAGQEEVLASYLSAMCSEPTFSVIEPGIFRMLENKARHGTERLKSAPGDAAILLELVSTLNKLGRHPEVLELCDRLMRIDASSARAHAERAYALTRLQRLAEARESLDRAVALDPQSVAARCARASFHARFENWEDARNDYEQAYLSEQSNEHIWRGLALLPEGQLSQERVHHMLGVLGDPPEDPRLAQRLFLKARLLRHLGFFAESFACLVCANELRLPNLAPPEDWRDQYSQFRKSAEEWRPRKAASVSSGTAARLLVILGPSRSGKTTLERLLEQSGAVFRGLEGAGTGPTIRALRRLETSERGSRSSEDAENATQVLEALFFSRTQEMIASRLHAITVTNPYLLPAATLIYDHDPGACFVFIERDPIDTAAEIFATDYRYRHPFAYRARDAANHVAVYHGISRVLLNKMGGRAISISYADLLADPPKAVASVHSLLGFDPAGALPVGRDERKAESPYRAFFAAHCAGGGST